MTVFRITTNSAFLAERLGPEPWSAALLGPFEESWQGSLSPLAVSFRARLCQDLSVPLEATAVRVRVSGWCELLVFSSELVEWSGRRHDG